VKIAIYQTGHEICDRISLSLLSGVLKGDCDAGIYHARNGIIDADVHIAYGILRGTGEIFKAAEARKQHWLCVDRGYWGANHYTGNYRICYRGTQAIYRGGEWLESGYTLEALPEPTKPKINLICPPSGYVCDWLGVNQDRWLIESLAVGGDILVRPKDISEPVDWNNVSQLITFNSSIAIDAIRRGIHVISDETYSSVGSFQHHVGEIHLDTKYRDRLLRWLSGHHTTLDKIERGDIWRILNHYLPKSTSAQIAANW
jgi:hypothetical protein